MSCGRDDYFLSRAAKIGRAARPPHARLHMVVGGWGAQVLLGLEGGGGEDDGREAPAMFFF